MSYFYGNKSTFLWIALLSTDVLEEDPRPGEEVEVMFPTGAALSESLWRLHLSVMYVRLEASQGGVQAGEGVVGQEENFYLNIFK